jgi:hypothetical protein
MMFLMTKYINTDFISVITGFPPTLLLQVFTTYILEENGVLVGHVVGCPLSLADSRATLISMFNDSVFGKRNEFLDFKTTPLLQTY